MLFALLRCQDVLDRKKPHDSGGQSESLEGELKKATKTNFYCQSKIATT